MDALKALEMVLMMYDYQLLSGTGNITKGNRKYTYGKDKKKITIEIAEKENERVI